MNSNRAAEPIILPELGATPSQLDSEHTKSEDRQPMPRRVRGMNGRSTSTRLRLTVLRQPATGQARRF